MKLTIVLGNQLFPLSYFSKFKRNQFFMAESYDLCTHFKYHKHKIIFFLSSMRHFKDELEKNNYQVHYEHLIEKDKKSFEEKLELFLKKNKVKEIDIFEIEDKFFEEKLREFSKRNKIKINIHETPMFQCSREYFKSYLTRTKRPFMKTFYEEERKRLKIMLEEDGSPLGGKWSFDESNRKKYPKNVDFPQIPNKKKLDDIDQEVCELVENIFPDHPGAVENFWIPTTRKETKNQLITFLNERVTFFGDFQDALTNQTVFGFHSVISPMMNSGYLTPKYVISEVLKIKISEENINSVEGFVRQVIGWREFVRGIYQNFDDRQQESNFFGHQRKLNMVYWYGEKSTGIEILDDCIQKAVEYSYCHHIERLMVLSNIMLLLEIHPREVYRWFMEMFSDSSDWVMGPNVFGMGQFSDGGVFATKPYISGSNYIRKMSDYKSGEWCDIWDGLYWRFMEKHREFLSKNPRMALTCKHLDKMDPKRKKEIFKKAKDFQNLVTSKN